MRYLFIVGCGRSGTTMLQQALNRHSRVAIPPETGFFLDFLGHSLRGQRQHLRRINADLDIDIRAPQRRVRVGESAFGLYEAIAGAYTASLGRPDVEYFGDKSPRHLLCIKRILRSLPEAKILLMFRDGRDVAISMGKVPWAHTDLYVNFAVWLRYYRRHRRLVGGGADVLEVRYEDLASRPREELRRITEFLGIDYEPPMAEGHGNLKGIACWEHEWKGRALQRIDTSRIGVWRNELGVVELARLERWGGGALTALGYECSTNRDARLPILFFARLWWKQAAWRARAAYRIAVKNVIGR